jgi:competence protein ComEC
MRHFTIISLLFFTINSAYSQLETHVLDIGAGLCTITKLPNGEVIVYDCGSLAKRDPEGQTGKNEIQRRLTNLLALGSKIDLLILSHTDADHINGAEWLFDNYVVKKLLWTSYSKENYLPFKDKDTKVYKNLLTKIKEEKCQEVDLFKLDSIITPGHEEMHGDVTFRYISGFNRPQDSWGIEGTHWRPQGYALNSVSITMQMEYQGLRIYFGGDAVGWLGDTLSATDLYVVQNMEEIDKLKSDVMIVPHHGSWNGSSPQLVRAINPRYAIFSSGHSHNHPSKTAVDRIIAHDSTVVLMRTDRGDSEYKFMKSTEYKDIYTDTKDRKDVLGDDEVIVFISKDSVLTCKYRDRF